MQSRRIETEIGRIVMSPVSSSVTAQQTKEDREAFHALVARLLVQQARMPEARSESD